MDGLPSPEAPWVSRLCRRAEGIGADGILLARPSSEADLRMEILNADGSVPEMCGNGLRCLVKYAVEQLAMQTNPLVVETGAGNLACHWVQDGEGQVARVRVAMGAPRFEREAIPMAGQGPSQRVPVRCEDREFEATGVGMGNPHMVIFEQLDQEGLRRWGPLLSAHPLWPQGTNVEFVRVLAANHLQVNVWERGCGLTRACGTGATAAVAAAVHLDHVPADEPVRTTLPGGDLLVTIAGDGSESWLEGPAVEVYRGSL